MKRLAWANRRLKYLAKHGTVPTMRPPKPKLGAPCPHCGTVLVRLKTAYVYGRNIICKKRYFERASQQNKKARSVPNSTLARKAIGRLKVAGFPKLLPCLVCDRPRKATWPGDRIHTNCHRARVVVAMEIDNVVARPGGEDTE